MAKLVYTLKGANQEFTFDTTRAEFTIGRNPKCDVRVNNPSISRKHAEIRYDGTVREFTIFDLNSSNGTFVNGKRARSQQLKHGDEVLCGEFKLFFVDEPARQSTAAFSPTGLGEQPPASAPPPPSAATSSGKPTGAPQTPGGAFPPPTPHSAPPTPDIPSDGGDDLEDALSSSNVLEVSPSGDVERAVSVTPVGSQSTESNSNAADDARLSRARQERDDLMDQVRTLTREIAELKGQLAAAGDPAQVDALRAELEQAQRDNAEAKTQIQARDEQLTATQAALETAEERIVGCVSEMETLRRDKATAEQAAAEARKSSPATSAEVATLHAKTNEVTRLTQDVAELKAQLQHASALEAALKTSREDLAAAESDGQSLREQLETVRTEALNATTKAESLEQKVAELGQAPPPEDHSDALAELERLKGENEDMKSAFSDLASELKTLVQLNETLRTEAERLKGA